MSEAPRMPGHCWDKQPGLDGIRCFEPPRHDGDHFNWYTRDRWPKRGGASGSAGISKSK